MFSLLKSLARAGADLDAHRNRYIINCNVFALIVIATSLPYPFIYLYLKVDIDPLLLSGSVVFLFSYSMVIFLNFLRVHTLAKLLFFATAVCQLFGICLVFGNESGLHQFFYAAFVGVFFVVDRHQKILLFPALLTLAAEYLLIQYINAYIDPIARLSPDTARTLNYISSGAVFTLLGAQCLHFYWSSLRGEIDLETARHQSDKLLLNILPETIADELKRNGTVEPVEHDLVTVVFTDFVGFTASSETRNPSDLLRQLDDCFSAFDAIIEKYNLEKLKTIGDAYMFAGGVPVDLKDNAARCVMAAKEIIAFVDSRRTEDPRFWQIRIGVHTGRLVAGVIGRKKFIYDVWGDTVNTASRLEAAGEPGKINTSTETYKLIKDKFSCLYRGEIAVKGKGPLAMYFVD
ncbi:adenylate/guanylate cyclase domain-containing protein [Turneriella parva]|uniref:Adenylate/guanylate cyclase n=1 Tax=Turneriella parva (strain ATCC BAA-1111 / DSM 21527 / NCTC 11395 / H) TaxID=869212 RepID=I4B5Y1_TURPD|nr:adenylate/guanylate cyclase domain-containing protein [Turneriella parva]AFM12688.1 adenylate/guanylate cyclase [Turneriella parva DSM 21527]